MIDPRTTNIVGQRVLIMSQNPDNVDPLGRGVVRVTDYQNGAFAFLIEAVGEVRASWNRDVLLAGNGELFQVTTFDETIKLVVDRESYFSFSLKCYIREIQHQLIKKYGFSVKVDASRAPIDVPDGEYPMTIDGRLDHVRVENGKLSFGNFDEDRR